MPPLMHHATNSETSTSERARGNERWLVLPEAEGGGKKSDCLDPLESSDSNSAVRPSVRRPRFLEMGLRMGNASWPKSDSSSLIAALPDGVHGSGAGGRAVAGRTDGD